MFHSASLSYHLTSFSEHKSLQHIDHHRAVAESANLWLLPHCKGEYVEGQGILAGVEALQASPDPPEQPVDSLAWFSGLTQRPPGQEQYFGPTDDDDSNHYHNFRNSFAPHLDLAGCLVATINQNRLENLARECKSEAERQKLIFQMQVARSVSPIPHAYDDGMGHFAWSPYESEEDESSEWSEMSVISSSIESDFESSEQDPDFLSCSAEQYYGTDESFESHSSDQRSKSI